MGWRVLPGLDLVRRNADGRPWRITTDADGARRTNAFRPGASRRVLVLGDSFAFGQGIDVGDRFDVVLETSSPGLSVVTLGVMGYGPDQELIRGRDLTAGLRDGDWLVLLTHGGDFWDLLRRRHAGRPKPWFERAGERLVEHPPTFAGRDAWRDRLYLLNALDHVFQARTPRPPPSAFTDARDLYRALVSAETAGLRARGVRVLLAHHWDHPEGPAFDVRAFFDGLCARGFSCLALDDVLRGPPTPFQADGHWNAAGHRVVAEALSAALADQEPAPETGAVRAETSREAARPTTRPKSR